MFEQDLRKVSIRMLCQKLSMPRGPFRVSQSLSIRSVSHHLAQVQPKTHRTKNIINFQPNSLANLIVQAQTICRPQPKPKTIPTFVKLAIPSQQYRIRKVQRADRQDCVVSPVRNF